MKPSGNHEKRETKYELKGNFHHEISSLSSPNKDWLCYNNNIKYEKQFTNNTRNNSLTNDSINDILDHTHVNSTKLR